MLTDMPSAKQFTIEGGEWEGLRFHYREMSKAAGAKKPSDRREEFYDPSRKDNILGRKQTRLEL